jgi:hypothetical protein
MALDLVRDSTCHEATAHKPYAYWIARAVSLGESAVDYDHEIPLSFSDARRHGPIRSAR